MDTCRLKGILSLIAATLLFSVMIVFAKLATQSLPATEVPVARYAFGLVAIIAASKILKFDLVGRDKKLLFLSGLTGSIGAYLFILALGYAPLGVVVVISFTFPVFAAITAHIFLKERIPGKQACVMRISANRLTSNMRLMASMETSSSAPRML